MPHDIDVAVAEEARANHIPKCLHSAELLRDCSCQCFRLRLCFAATPEASVALLQICRAVIGNPDEFLDSGVNSADRPHESHQENERTQCVFQFDLRGADAPGGTRTLIVHGCGEGIAGPKEARLSASDWLDESERMDSPPRSEMRDWRAVTIAVSARLASRVRVPPHLSIVLTNS